MAEQVDTNPTSRQTVSGQTVLRPLETSEFLHYLSNRVLDGSTNLVMAGELIPKQIASNYDALNDANLAASVSRLVRMHCHLQVTVNAREEFVRHNITHEYDCKDVIVRRTETFHADGDVADVAAYDEQFRARTSALIQELFAISFDKIVAPPLLRVGVLSFSPSNSASTLPRRYSLVVAIPHYVGDMQSVSTIFMNLSFLIRGIPVNEPAESAPVPPTYQTLLPENRRGLFRFLFRGGFGAFKRLFNGDPKVWFGPQTIIKQDTNEKDQPPKITAGPDVARRLDASFVSALNEQAKKRNIKLHSVLIAAASIAHAVHLPVHGNAKLRSFLAKQATKGHDRVGLSILVNTPVDVRRWHSPPVPKDVVASVSYSIVSAAHVEVSTKVDANANVATPDASTFWTVAEAAHTDLYTQVDQQLFWFTAWAAECIPKSAIRKTLTSADSMPQVTDKGSSLPPLCVGNVGMIDDGNSSAESTADLKDVVVFFHSGPGLYVAVVTTSTGMSLSLTGNVETEPRNKIVDSMVSILKAAATSA
eukprot:Colp12_sorted_trinity150504_noHs@30042